MERFPPFSEVVQVLAALRRIVVIAVVAGGVATVPVTTQAQAAPRIDGGPPAGGVLVEGESIPGASRRADNRASGRAYGRLTRGSATVAVAAGHYTLTARVRSVRGTARVDLLTADQAAGSFGITEQWSVVSAGMWVSAGDRRVGVGSWARVGAPGAIEVDWLHVAPAAASFTVEGTTIRRGNGQPYRIVGFNKGDYQDAFMRDGRLHVASNEAYAMHAWGASTVRIGLNQEFWLADCPVWAGTTPTTYRRAISNEVGTLISRGVLVMLSLTSTERGANTGCNVTDGILREMADARSLRFWTDVATTFQRWPQVMFDLYNEPHSITPDVWRNGGRVTYGPRNQTFTAVGMQQLYDTVRATGARNLVVVSGTSWAGDPRVHLTHPLDGWGIVAGTHSYCEECPDTDYRPDDLLDQLNTPAVFRRLPLTLTEVGTPGHDDPTYLATMLDWADDRGIGWLAYAWLAGGPGAPDRYSLLGSWFDPIDVGGVMTRRPTPSAAAVWNRLAPFRTQRGFLALPMPETRPTS